MELQAGAQADGAAGVHRALRCRLLRLPRHPSRHQGRRGGPHFGHLHGRRRCGAARHRAALTVAWLIGVARHKLVDHWRGWPARSAGCRRLPNPRCSTIRGTRASRPGRRTRCWPAWDHTTGCPHPALHRRSSGAAGRRPVGPHGARDRGAARARPPRLPPCLRDDDRGGRLGCLRHVIPSTPCACR